MKRILNVLPFAAIIVALFTVFLGPATFPVIAQDTLSLAAARVNGGIATPLDVAWDKIPALTVPLEGEVKDSELPTTYGVHYSAVPEVKLQVVYDDKTIWTRAVWPDDTMNSNFAEWTFDGTKWSQNKLRQDRLALMFDISGGAQFKALGCGAACHQKDDSAGDYMGFPVSSPDTTDVWQWKSSQTAFVSYADDQWIGAYVDAKGPQGPVNDAGTGAVPTANKNKAGDAPAFMYPKDGVPGSPLLADSAVAFDPKATFEVGATLPGYTVARPKGSRGDISASSFYVKDSTGKGWWYVVLSRPLSTGNPEDHVFTLNSSNVFGVAVFNNSDDKLHSTHDKLILTIGK